MKLLVVVGRYPWPPRRGDQLRADQLLRAAVPMAETTLLAPDPEFDAPPAPGEIRLVTYEPGIPLRRLAAAGRAAAGGRPLQCGLYRSPDLLRRARALAGTMDLVVVQLARLVGAAEAIDESIPLITDLVDVLSASFESRARIASLPVAVLLRLEARRLRRVEGRLGRRSERLLVVSSRDRDDLVAAGHLPGSVASVPLAVPVGRGSESPRAEPVVALTGNLGYAPNRDGARWLASRVWPLVRSRRPDARLVVAGARPSRKTRLAVERVGGELVADPPDLAPILARARIATAPLRCGAGVPVKVLEAWAAGRPVVASPWAAAGVGPGSGEALVVAETPEEWASALLRLLEDDDEARHLAEAGRRRLEERHRPDLVAQRFREALGIGSGEGREEEARGVRQEG